MTRESVIEKIQKLLALAGNNPSMNEAALAAAMAQKLMLEHKLSMSELEMDERDDEPIVEHDVLRDERGRSPRQWKVTLLNGIANNNSCMAVYWSARFHVGENKHLNRGKMTRGKLVVFGKKSDVDTVLYLYQWLVKEVEQLSKKAKAQLKDEIDVGYNDEEISVRTWADSFRKGCADTISNKLYAQRKAQEQQIRSQAGAACTALVRIDKQAKEVEKFVESKYKVSKSGKKMTADEEAYIAGREAAKNIDLDGSKGKLTAPAKQIEGGKK